MPSFLLEWERLLWSGRPGILSGWRSQWLRYHITDCRIVVSTWSGRLVGELLLDDVTSVELRQSTTERLTGASSVVIRCRGTRAAPIELAAVRNGPQIALVLQLLAAGGLGIEHEPEFFKEALNRRAPDLLRPSIANLFPFVASLAAAGALIFVVSGANHAPSPISYPAGDAIFPNGVKRDRAAIVAFMQNEVMPVARRVLAPIKGGSEQVTCDTCHGSDAHVRAWSMPAVRALPEPHFRMAGLERYNRRLDPQIRNAIYGYMAEEEKQGAAAYMRGVVLPEIARVLGRPAYDFTRSYEYNRVRAALGCYHCHQVEPVTASGG